MTWNLLKHMRRRRSAASRAAIASQSSNTSFVVEEPNALIDRHRKRVTGLRLESGYNARDFHRFVQEPLWLCAAYVQNLPASRAENHRDPGGLFRFCIETAHLSFRRADGKLFHDVYVDEEVPATLDSAWRYAALLAGLSIPLGRVASAVRVSSLEGDKHWNPYAGSLHEWATSNGLSEYTLDWRPNQDARSTTGANSWLAARLLGREVLDRLYEAHPVVIETLIDVLNGRSEHTLSRLVSESVVAVTDQDLANARGGDHLPVTGIRAEHRVLDAIRGLIRDKWTCNTPGSRVWVTSDGVFINWKPAVNDLMVRIRANGSSGGLTDPDSIAELLVEHDILSINSHPTSSKVLPHYHRITVHAPHIPKHPMDCVRVANPTLLGLQLGTVSPVDVEVAGRPSVEPAVGDLQPDLLSSVIEEASPPPDTADAAPEECEAPEEQASSKASVTFDTAPLRRYGTAGEVLIELAQAEQSPFVAIEEGLALAYPTAVAGVCDNPAEFLTSCRTQSLLVASSNARKPTVIRKRSKEQTELPDQYIVLVPRLAEVLGLSGSAA